MSFQMHQGATPSVFTLRIPAGSRDELRETVHNFISEIRRICEIPDSAELGYDFKITGSGVVLKIIF